MRAAMASAMGREVARVLDVVLIRPNRPTQRTKGQVEPKQALFNEFRRTRVFEHG